MEIQPILGKSIMVEGWLKLTNIPAEGREFSFETTPEWIKFVSKFHLEFKLKSPLVMVLTIFPQKKGFLIQGTLQGYALFPCDRCLEPAKIEIKSSFDFFEEFEPQEIELLGERLLRYVDDHFELNVFQVLWEQFLLALPEKKLCQKNCKGLCPKCGQNLNQGECSCEQDNGDPRLSIFRQLKINSK